MDFTPTFERIEKTMEKCLNATDRITMAVDLGNATGSILTIIELGCVDYKRIQDYMAEIRAMVAMVEMQIIEV